MPTSRGVMPVTGDRPFYADWIPDSVYNGRLQPDSDAADGDKQPDRGTVTITDQQPAAADLRLSLDRETTPTDVVTGVARHDAFAAALRCAAVQTRLHLSPDIRPTDYAQYLRDDDVTALSGLYADVVSSLVTDLSHGIEDDSLSELVDVTASFGSGRNGPLGLRQPFAGWATGPAALLAMAEVDLTIAVTVQSSFWETDYDRRQTILSEVIGPLCPAADVSLVGGFVTQRKLGQQHRDALPGVVDAGVPDLPESVSADVAAAAEEIAVGDSLAQTLIAISDREPVTYGELASSLSVERPTVRDHARQLADLGLVERWGPQSDRRVSVTPAGERFYAEELASQQRLGDGVGSPPKSSSSQSCNHASTCGGGTADRSATTRWLDRPAATAALGASTQGAVTALDRPVEQYDRGDRGWSEPHLAVPAPSTGVVSHDVQSPLHLVVGTAEALWSSRARSQLWSADGLEPLQSVLDDHQHPEGSSVEFGALKSIRNLPHLYDDLETTEEWLDAVQQGVLEMRDLTVQIKECEDPEEESHLRSSVMKRAHGYIAAAASLADMCDIDLRFQFRFPRYSERLAGRTKTDRRSAIAETVARVLGKVSLYRGHVLWRHEFEDRPEKRDQTPDVQLDGDRPDACPAVGVQLVGDGVTSFAATDLPAALDDLDSHPDAPAGLAGAVPIRELTHVDWRRTIERAASLKGLTAGRNAVCTLRAVCDAPIDAARGVVRGLSEEERERPIRADEVRRALAVLDDDALLTGQTPTVSAAVSVLAAADTALSTAELARRADVSTQSIRNNSDDLLALGLVEQTSAGWQLRLSFDHRHHGGRHWPFLVSETDDVSDVLLLLASQLDVDVSTGFWLDPPDDLSLVENWPLGASWLPVLRGLCGVDREERDDRAPRRIERDAVQHDLEDQNDLGVTGPSVPIDDAITVGRLGEIQHRQAGLASAAE